MKHIPLSVKRYLYLLNGVLLLLLLGVGYAWSIFVGPLEAWFGWSRTETSLAFTLNIIFFAVGVICCGILSKYFHYQRIAQLAGLLLAGGFLLTTRVTEIWQLYLTYSVLCGASVGMCYSAVISTIPLWFRDRSGFATGILIMGYALSTTLLGPVCQTLLSSLGWQTTFFILGIVDLIIIILGGCFVRMPKAKEFEALPAPSMASVRSTRNVPTKEMLKSPTFYFIFVYIVTLGSVGLAVINHISPLLTGELGMAAAAAAMVVSIGSLFNGFGRLIIGVIFDKIGGIATTRLLSTVNVAVVLLMYLAYRSQYLPALLILVCAALFIFGGNSSTIPSVTRGLYGDEHFASNYSIIMLNSVFSPITASIVGVLQERTGSYEYMFYLLVFCAVSSTICAWSARESK